MHNFDTPVFVYDLDDTIFAGSFFSNLDELFKKKILNDGFEEGFCDINDVSILMDIEETETERIKFHMRNLLEVLKKINENHEKKIPQYIATFNRSHIFEKDFVQKSFDKMFELLNQSKNLKLTNPIRTKNVFAFVQKPDEKNVAADLSTWAKEHGKNIHIIMSIVDQFEPASSQTEKYTKSLSFILSNGIPFGAEEQKLFSDINSNLKNVHFFDDNENNIYLAKQLGVNAYLVNNLEKTQTLHARLLKAHERIELSKTSTTLVQESCVFARKKRTNINQNPLVEKNINSLIEGLNTFSFLKSEEVIKVEERINLSSSSTEVGETPVSSISLVNGQLT